jgi:pseudouridine-5'-phosphate glycosidase
MDVSADLEELARTDVAVVCAGVKSVLDIGRTLEYLETRGVPVVGYRTEAKWEMGLSGGMVIANPIPAAHALDGDEIDAVIDDAIEEMEHLGITGKDTTPFLLAQIAERTEGRSLAANIELVVNNARLAAEIARVL